MKVILKMYKNGNVDSKTCRTKTEATKLGKKFLSQFTMNEKVKNKASYSISKSK